MYPEGSTPAPLFDTIPKEFSLAVMLHILGWVTMTKNDRVPEGAPAAANGPGVRGCVTARVLAATCDPRVIANDCNPHQQNCVG